MNTSDPYTRAEIDQIFKTLNPKSFSGCRTQAILAILWRCGTRVTETLRIMPKDIDRADHSIRLKVCKGGSQRTIGLDAGSWSMLERWIEFRSRYKHGMLDQRDIPIFCTRYGGWMYRQNVALSLTVIAKLAELDRPLPCHGFRHTFTIEHVNEGTNIVLLQKMLGHKSLSTTQAYTNHLRPRDVIDCMQNREW